MYWRLLDWEVGNLFSVQALPLNFSVTFVGILHLSGLSFLHLHHINKWFLLSLICHSVSWRIATAWPEHWRMQLFSFSPWATIFLYYHQRGEEVLCWIIALRKPAIADQPKSIPVRSLSGCSSVVHCILIFQCYWVPITWKRLCWVGIEQ